jgi:hypothetical protein
MTPLQSAFAGLSIGGIIGALIAWLLHANFAVDPCSLTTPCGFDVDNLGPGGAARLWGMTFTQLMGAFAAGGGVLGFIVQGVIKKGS